MQSLAINSPQAELAAILASIEKNTAGRIDHFSKLLMKGGTTKNPLGEGPGSVYDERALYRFDMFDCHTYIQTTLCLALANSPEDFEKLCCKMLYHDASPGFFNRYRFIHAQWIPGNLKNGYIKDITADVMSNHRMLRRRTARSSYRKWHAKLIASVDYCTCDPEIVLKEVKRTGALMYRKSQHAMRYIPFGAFFVNTGNPGEADRINEALINGIPDASIIVFRNSDDDVHMAFLFWKDGSLVIRHTYDSLSDNTKSGVTERSFRWYLIINRLYARFKEVTLYSCAVQ